MTTEVSTGFQDDCFVFIEKFIKAKSLDYATFCETWNGLEFHQIFYGRASVEELNAFIEEAFIIIKRVLIRSTHLNERICCLFLLYSIYVKQPRRAESEKDLDREAKIRLTLNDWINLKAFYKDMTGPSHRDAIIVFNQLIKIDAYHFCLLDTKSFNDKDKVAKDNDVDPEMVFKPITGQIIHDMESLESNEGILNALQALEIAYNEMKEQLGTGNEAMDTGLPATNLVSEVNESISQIQQMMQRNRALRRRRRRKSSRIETQDERSEDDTGKTIKEKRVSIKARALKVEKRKRLTTYTSDTEYSPEKSTPKRKKLQETPPAKKPTETIKDQKHFRKITTLQQIFEHNIMLKEVREQIDYPALVSDEPGPSTSSVPAEQEVKKTPKRTRKSQHTIKKE